MKQDPRDYTITKHFQDRFRERLSTRDDPVQTGRRLIWAAENLLTDIVRPMGRSRNPGRRKFLARTSEGHAFIAVIDTEVKAAITLISDTVTDADDTAPPTRSSRYRRRTGARTPVDVEMA